MSDGRKESRFLQKWKLVRAAARDNKRLSTGDIAVLMALCDRYGSKYDPDAPALAGHALLGAMAGLTRRATIDSTRRLIDAGYIAIIELGSGTRGTRYGLNFARGEGVITTTEDNASGEAEFTTVVNPSAPLDPRSGEGHFTESPPTESRLQASLHVVGSMFEAAPTAPSAAGLSATAAVTASGEGDEFKAFWEAWPRKHGKKKAEAEWKRIDASLRGTVIAVAGAWADHYAKHGVDKKWIPEPANWLKGERWDEDLPLIHVDAKGAAIAKAKANAPAKAPAEPENTEEPAVEWCGEISPFVPSGTHRIKVTAASTIADAASELLSLVLDVDDGGSLLTGIPHTFPIRSCDQAVEERGQANLRVISSGQTSDDVSDLVGSECRMCVGKDGRVTYLPLVRNAVPGLADRIKAARAAGAFSAVGAAA